MGNGGKQQDYQGAGNSCQQYYSSIGKIGWDFRSQSWLPGCQMGVCLCTHLLQTAPGYYGSSIIEACVPADLTGYGLSTASP